MPNYDYYCEYCKRTVERSIPIEERELQNCSECSEPMKRLYSFKGAVWSPTKNGGHS